VKADVRARLGRDQARWLQSAGAPIPPAVLEYFGALGLPICGFWGMSELSCCATINPLDDIRIGTVGKAIPGVELKLLDDGELLACGPLVMKGYRRDPEKTAQAVDAEGWMHTGDVATIDEDGTNHQRRRQEHVAGEHRAEAEGVESAHRAGDLHRRQAALQRRAARARSRRRRPMGATARPRERRAGGVGKHPDCCLVLLLDTKVTSRDRRYCQYLWMGVLSVLS